MTQAQSPVELPALLPAKITIEQYHQMIDAGILEDCAIELLNGELIQMPSEGAPHAGLSTRSRDYLIGLLGDRAQVREGHPITLSVSASEPEPDLAIVEPSPDYYTQRHPYPENVFWLIEYADSSLKKDLDPKAKVYANAEILEYWVVNLRAMELVVFRDPVNGEYRSQTIHTTGTINPVAFPTVAIEVARLLG